MNTLFVAWQDQADTRAWFVVGRLDRIDVGYRFQYVNQVRVACNSGFEPMLEFRDINAKYESNKLFPLFENRLLSRSRPDYGDFLKRIAISEDSYDPIAILGRTEGLRATDSFEVFSKPEPDEHGNYHVVFFARGIRHLSPDIEKLVAGLVPGDDLDIELQDDNTHDCNAILVRSDGTQVGWIPKYLCADVRRLRDSYGDEMRVRVERVNSAPAPVQQRLLCSISAPWPESWEPFSDESFQGVEVSA